MLQLTDIQICINTLEKDAAVTARKTIALPFAAVPGAASQPVSALRRAVAAAMAWQSHRRSVAALARLDDRLLRDVGLTRDMLDARGPFDPT